MTIIKFKKTDSDYKKILISLSKIYVDNAKKAQEFVKRADIAKKGCENIIKNERLACDICRKPLLEHYYTDLNKIFCDKCIGEYQK